MNNSLNDLEIYKISLELSQKSWEIYGKIPKYLKYSFGNQFLSAIDSIGANIAEGFGRYHYKDSLKFYYYSRGSLWESKFWLELLFQRQLIDSDLYEDFKRMLINLSVKLNNFIQTIQVKTIKENNL